MEINESTKKKIDDLVQELRDNNISYIITTGSGLVEASGTGTEITNMVSLAIIGFCKETGVQYAYKIILNRVNTVVRGVLSQENREGETAARENIIRQGVEDFIQDMKKKLRDAGIDADIEAAVVSTDDFDSNEDITGDEYS